MIISVFTALGDGWINVLRPLVPTSRPAQQTARLGALIGF